MMHIFASMRCNKETSGMGRERLIHLRKCGLGRCVPEGRAKRVRNSVVRVLWLRCGQYACLVSLKHMRTSHTCAFINSFYRGPNIFFSSLMNSTHASTTEHEGMC
jgi:hypothetical protein